MLPTRHIAAVALLAWGGPAGATQPPAHRFDACGASGICATRPGPPDRDVRPFEGSLGRPCGYRWRATPEGARRVRVCF